MPLCDIGIDLGTSGVRACAIDADDRILREASVALPASTGTKPGHYQQDPSDWWRCCLTVLDDLLQDQALQPQRIAVDGTSGTLLLCDSSGAPLSPGLMYNDSRASREAARLKPLAPPGAAVHSPGSALAKLCYLHHCLPPETAHALHQADWIVGRLCGEYGISDENNALKMGYDPVNRCWPGWLEACPIETRLLPRVVAVGQPVGQLQLGLRKRWHLAAPVNIIAGTTDSNAATLASGISAPGEASTALGSTLVLKVFSEHPVFNPRFGIYSHRLGNRWLVGGASNSGGAVLSRFFTPERIRQLSQQIDPTRDSGLDFYPLPSPGERFPQHDPSRQPVISPRPKDDARYLQGLLEGIARIEVKGYQRLQQEGAPYPLRVVSSGGGAANQPWSAIRERLLGVPVQAATHTQAAFGSALIAAGRVDS